MGAEDIIDPIEKVRFVARAKIEGDIPRNIKLINNVVFVASEKAVYKWWFKTTDTPLRIFHSPDHPILSMDAEGEDRVVCGGMGRIWVLDRENVVHEEEFRGQALLVEA